MISWLKSPQLEALTNYIECYWFIEKYPDSSGHQSPKLNPDPSAHLIICPEDQAYHYQMNEQIESGRGTHWLFPHQQTLQLDHRNPFLHLGIKFHVGALYTLPLAGYTEPLLDSATETSLSQLLNAPDNAESEIIELARDNPEQCCARLDTLLLSWITSAKQDKHSAITQQVLQLLDTHPISELGAQLHCSQRTVERSFNRVTGLNLKQCQAMNKLEAMLVYLYQRDSSEINWSEVALQFGFSDQPHLIRYLKKQIGATPKAYAQERGLTIDVYGGVEPL